MFNYVKVFGFFILIILIAWVAGAIMNMKNDTKANSIVDKLPFKIINEARNGDNIIQGNESIDCVPAGCSKELCVEEDVARSISSICEYKDIYSCYKKAKCEKQNNGNCGWTETKELIDCVGKF